MKKSLWTLIIAVCFMIPCLFMFNACGGNPADPNKLTSMTITLDNETNISSITKNYAYGEDSNVIDDYNNISIGLVYGNGVNTIANTIPALLGSNTITMKIYYHSTANFVDNEIDYMDFVAGIQSGTYFQKGNYRLELYCQQQSVTFNINITKARNTNTYSVVLKSSDVEETDENVLTNKFYYLTECSSLSFDITENSTLNTVTYVGSNFMYTLSDNNYESVMLIEKTAYDNLSQADKDNNSSVGIRTYNLSYCNTIDAGTYYLLLNIAETENYLSRTIVFSEQDIVVMPTPLKIVTTPTITYEYGIMNGMVKGKVKLSDASFCNNDQFGTVGMILARGASQPIPYYSWTEGHFEFKYPNTEIDYSNNGTSYDLQFVSTNSNYATTTIQAPITVKQGELSQVYIQSLESTQYTGSNVNITFIGDQLGENIIWSTYNEGTQQFESNSRPFDLYTVSETLNGDAREDCSTHINAGNYVRTYKIDSVNYKWGTNVDTNYGTKVVSGDNLTLTWTIGKADQNVNHVVEAGTSNQDIQIPASKRVTLAPCDGSVYDESATLTYERVASHTFDEGTAGEETITSSGYGGFNGAELSVTTCGIFVIKLTLSETNNYNGFEGYSTFTIHKFGFGHQVDYSQIDETDFYDVLNYAYCTNADNNYGIEAFVDGYYVFVDEGDALADISLPDYSAFGTWKWYAYDEDVDFSESSLLADLEEQNIGTGTKVWIELNTNDEELYESVHILVEFIVGNAPIEIISDSSNTNITIKINKGMYDDTISNFNVSTLNHNNSENMTHFSSYTEGVGALYQVASGIQLLKQGTMSITKPVGDSFKVVFYSEQNWNLQEITDITIANDKINFAINDYIDGHYLIVCLDEY